VKITQLGPAGDEVIVWLKGPGEVIGGPGQTPGATNECGAESIEPCHIVYWDARVLKVLSDRSSVLQHNAVINLAECLDGLQARFCELATEKVALRLARTLARLHESAVQTPGDEGRISLSREELAQMTGTTLFAVSRLLSEWTQLGIIDARREAILVHDTLRLIDFAREEHTTHSGH
jgi:CRP-like cAMP-binding protein